MIGSPLVTSASIRLFKGKPLRVEAHNNSADNRYVQRVLLNGKEISRTWFTHDDISRGGELKFHMGPKPNKHWGIGPADAPPSCIASSTH